MRIHSICVVKNESDIIVQSLTAAAEWSDFIYVSTMGAQTGHGRKCLISLVGSVRLYRSEERTGPLTTA